MTSELDLTTAERLRRNGHLREAEEICRKVLLSEPANARALHLLGVIVLQQGHTDVAADHFREAITIDPLRAEAHANLGMVLRAIGKLEEATASYERAIELDPAFFEAHYNLGNILLQLDKLDEAIVCYRQAIALKPDLVVALHNLATALQMKGQYTEAIAELRRALELKPDDPERSYRLAVVLEEGGYLDEATGLLLKTVQLHPHHFHAWNYLACVFQEQSEWSEAERCHVRALQLDPANADTHANYAFLLLTLGRFSDGWRKFALRPKRGQFAQPEWSGEPLHGRRIVLHAEQGFGDTLQFARYAPLVKQFGATVILECQPPLVRLLCRCPGVDQVVGYGEQLPPFDVHAPLMSLPGIFGTTLATIPAAVPYLFADERLVEVWKERLEGLLSLKGVKGEKEYLIGINWRGRPGKGAFRLRDIPLAMFERIANLPGVRLVSLQRGEGREEFLKIERDREAVLNGGTNRASRSLDMQDGGLGCGGHSPPYAIDLGDDVDQAQGAFMDTAAVMMNLDLVITSDTSIAHLAGALAVPVWVALPHVPDWRWLLDRSDSPWYPTMRLFRQKQPGDWGGVFEEIEGALRERVD